MTDAERLWYHGPVGEAQRAPDREGEEVGPPPGPAPLRLGDRVEALAHKIGADRMAAWIEAKTGRPCGCAERKEALNRLDSWLRTGPG